jgi:hypothetical protein
MGRKFKIKVEIEAKVEVEVEVKVKGILILNIPPKLSNSFAQ